MLPQVVAFVLFLNLLISTICDGIRPSRSDIWHLKQEPFCGQSFVPEINRRIVGGSEANFGQFPWQAQIWTFKPYNDTPIFSCGGTLISDELILTAAHCVHFTNPERYTIILGRQYLDENYEICTGYEQVFPGPYLLLFIF